MSTPPCTDTKLELWFGPRPDATGRTPESRAEHKFRESRAKSICRSCPLLVGCLENELVRPIGHQFGIVAATTAAERRDMIRARRAAALAVAPVAAVA
ncbi:WhiB family transcriptional regulator [Umezawaea beigongshangensis]|uniref:WhiB family transcriptional regulator n=1 Tax=Umezawaea beigongshangensis TaxID=2780383 RepID=UPI0018F27740|nr:WhiB family transcriptional regulator [Umezawaea beigongshangensis]